MRRAILTVAACATLLSVSTAHAVGTDEQKCLAGRAKAKGKFEQCVEKWLSNVYVAGGLVIGAEAKLAKCRSKYADAWTKLQGLTGSTTCVLARFVDNGTTVTDNLTGLVWEKKTTVVGSGMNLGGDRHDVDNSYTWTTSDGDTADEDGEVFTDFLTSLNGAGGFASANGWRLPTLAELLTIMLPSPFPCTTHPCIDATFGPTQSLNYWSATTYEGDRNLGWLVGDAVGLGDHATSSFARAVRAGL